MGSFLFNFNHALSIGLTRTAKPILLWLLILLLGLRPQSGHAQTAPVSQPGLKASYFGGTTLSGTPLSRVTVPNIDFDWGIGSPEPGMPVDDWSARYEGMIEAPYSGEIEFHTLSDDGIRLWVDGQQIINNWTEHAPTLNTGRITLVQGQKVPIVCEFYERAGGATARLQWNYSGENPSVVPSSALSSVEDPAFPPGTTADRTGPQVTIVTPANGSTSVTPITGISGTVKDPIGAAGEAVTGIASVRVCLSANIGGVGKSWNGTAWVAQGAHLPVTWSVPDAQGVLTWTCTGTLPSVMQRGPYAIDVHAYDQAGNWGGKTHTIYITPDDTIRPEVIPIMPAENSNVSKLRSLSGTVFDPVAPDGTPGSGVNSVDLVLEGPDDDAPYWNGSEWTESGGSSTTLSAPDAQGHQTWSWNGILPSGAQLLPGLYTLHVFAYDNYQNQTYRPYNFSVVLGDPSPDIAIRALEEDETSFIGLGQNDESGAAQTKTGVTVPNAARAYILKIRNNTGAAQSLKLSAPADADGWTTRVYDGLLADETKNITGVVLQGGWPLELLSGTEREVRVEVTPGEAGVPSRVVPVTLALANDSSNKDVARIEATLQKVAQIETSLDYGKTWTDAPAPGGAAVLTVPQYLVVGFRAKRANPNAPWPTDPYKPIWQRGVVSHYGSTVWLHFPTVTPTGDADEEIKVEGGNTVSVRVRVSP